MSCSVVQVKTAANDGYDAVQIGFAKKKDKNAPKGESAHAKKAGLDSTPRVLSEVRLDGASALKQGDVVTQLDDRRIDNADALVAAVRSHAPNDQVKLVVGRNSTVQATLGGQPVELK